MTGFACLDLKSRDNALIGYENVHINGAAQDAQIRELARFFQSRLRLPRLQGIPHKVPKDPSAVNALGDLIAGASVLFYEPSLQGVADYRGRGSRFKGLVRHFFPCEVASRVEVALDKWQPQQATDIIDLHIEMVVDEFTQVRVGLERLDLGRIHHRRPA